MVRVMATGVFDILHLGHVHFLQEAKRLGNELIVIVARDATVEKSKHRPVMSQEMRVELIRSLKVVDQAFLGHEENHFNIVEEIKPDIIALGYDQFHSENKIHVELARHRGKNVFGICGGAVSVANDRRDACTTSCSSCDAR